MAARKVARISTLLAAIILFASHAQPQAQRTPPAKQKAAAPQVRMKWQDFISGPDGAKRLASLQKAIQKMKSLDNSPKNSADYRRSWQYWANIHGYYGPQSPDGTVQDQIQYLNSQQMGQYVPYYQGITDQTPPDATAAAIWATCQHSSQTTQANFFGWHRMYLYYYERVLRWAAGDNTLRLPYWDYTDPAQLVLPPEFQATSSTLYDAKRDPQMNTGGATLDTNETNVNPLLPLTNYLSYESQIEQGIHGYVHCTVGPTCPVAHMGDVPVAGNDPVFYSHHANIDRLWACWQKLHPTPKGAWQTQKFSFVDETGALKTRQVKDFLNSVPLGYVYDNDSSCARPGTVLMRSRAMNTAAAAPQGNKPMLGSTKGIAINSPQISVDLAVPKPKLQNALADLETAEATELVLRDVTAESNPGVSFNVYLARKSDPANRQHVGTISWFGAFRHHGSKGPEKRTYHYDVTSQLRALGGASLASDGLTVTIEATNGRVVKDPAKTEEQRRQVNAAFRPQAKLVIGAVEFHGSGNPPRTGKKKK